MPPSSPNHQVAATEPKWWATKNEWVGLIDVAELEVESLTSGFAS